MRANRSKTQAWVNGTAVGALKLFLPPVENQTSSSTAVCSAVSFDIGTQKRHVRQTEGPRDHWRSWWRKSARYPGMSCFTAMGFRRLQLSQCSIYIWAKKELEGEAPGQLPARLEHKVIAGACLHLQGWVWPVADPSLKPDVSSSLAWGQLYRSATHFTSSVAKLIALNQRNFLMRKHADFGSYLLI